MDDIGPVMAAQKFDERRATLGEVIGGGYIVLRRGKTWKRIRIDFTKVKKHCPFEWPTIELACEEAMRLATSQPGETFCIFKQCGVFMVPKESDTALPVNLKGE